MVREICKVVVKGFVVFKCIYLSIREVLIMGFEDFVSICIVRYDFSFLFLKFLLVVCLYRVFVVIYNCFEYISLIIY